MATLRQVLDALIDKFIPDIRKAFLASIQDIVDNVILADVVAAIKEGDIEKAFRAIGYSDAAMRPLTASIERAFETGGVTVGTTFPRVLNTSDGRAVFRFDVRNSRAEAYLRDQSSRLVTSIGDDARTSVRQFLTDGMQDGRNPRNVALDMIGRVDQATGRRVGGIIGLTPGQERWVARTQQQLEQLDPRYFDRALRDKRFDRTVAAAIRDGKPLSADTISKLVGRYKDNALKYRGETIARTEAIGSLNRSEYEALKQAADSGAMKPSAVQRIWDNSGDKRVRHSHVEMEGQTVGLDEAFTFPGGGQAMFPGDSSMGAPAEEIIQCRCRARTKVDWFDGVK